MTTENHPDIIIKGGSLITMADGETPVNNAVILIRDDRIIDIITGDENDNMPEKAEIINAENCIIMPGLINSHSHTAMTIFRGYADDMPLKKWLFEKIFPAEAAHMNPESVYWGTLLGCLEMIASGTTTVMDGYFHEDSAARAVHESGLRGLMAQGVIDFPAPGIDDPSKNLRVGKEFMDKWKDKSDLITPGLFCHSPVTCSDRTLKKAMEISREYSVPMQIHLSETAEEVEEIIKRTGKRPVEYLDKLGLLGCDLIAAHSIHLDDNELDILAKKNVRVVHAPESNMKLASGVAKISEMVKRGIAVGLGTDGCASNNNLDMFQEMDSAAKMGKVFTMDPLNMDALTVMKMATCWGAKVMNVYTETGSIEKGKKADIIIVDTESPHMVPVYNPLSTIVYSANGSDVKDVIVNGRILMKDRQFKTLDRDGILEKVNAISHGIMV
jgi:5-methylthioadenosine/S-adenosylhomocysteine deaminase